MKEKANNEGQKYLDRVLETLQRNEPVLSHPEQLTEEIMNTIRPIAISRFPRLITLQRFLTAASVCLLLTFGVEQFMVVKKVNNLELRNNSIEVAPYATISRRIAEGGIPFSKLSYRFRLKRKLLSATSNVALKQMHVKFQNEQK